MKKYYKKPDLSFLDTASEMYDICTASGGDIVYKGDMNGYFEGEAPED